MSAGTGTMVTLFLDIGFLVCALNASHENNFFLMIAFWITMTVNAFSLFCLNVL